MRLTSKASVVLLSTLSLLLPAAAISQTEDTAPVAVPSLILSTIDDARRVQLRGNVHPSVSLASKEGHDEGVVEPSLPMQRMLLILERSPEQEAALQQFMAEQYQPGSPNFHRWLEPEEFGQRFGLSNQDMSTVTNWLRDNGFTIDTIGSGRVYIEFSGNAALVQKAFHTEIHHYLVHGEEHIANATDPSIPEALRPAVAGVFSLHNFLSRPLHRSLGTFRRNASTGKWLPVDATPQPRPSFTTTDGSGNQFELISPYDFAKIYNVQALWNANIDGSGQTIAIAGRSDISLSDVAKFRSSFGLPAKAPTITVNGADPGVPSADDKSENTLDVEWSGAVAKGATINFVTTASTNTSDGAISSATYIIDKKTAPVMSFSYGSCELQLQTAGNTAINKLWQQGAAEGITIFVASGDQGSAACDGGGTTPDVATFGLQVSGDSTTPYNVAVGGTDFNWVNSSKTYWNASNASNGSSVVSYIPEVPWNGTCASNAVDEFVGGTAAGYDAEQTCEALLNQGVDEYYIGVTGGTGGKSACTTPSSTTAASCSGGYAKPSWQAGTGVPADGKRDVPDVSLFASSGALNTAYAICDSESTPCDYSDSNDALAQAVGGTSVSSPAMAGIMALVNQKMGAAQGNANVGFYALAAKDTRSSCNSNSVGSGNSCNFYDTTSDNNAVPCQPGSPNCTVHHSGDNLGIMNGYTSTTGYDLATGLGSVNAANLVNNWHLVSSSTAAVSLSPTSLTFSSTKVGSTSSSQTVTLKNTGSATLTISSIAVTGTNTSSFSIPSKTCGSSLSAGSSCTFSVAFKPASTGSLSASISVTDNASGSPQSVKVSGTGAASSSGLTLSPTSIAFGSEAVGSTSEAHAVTVKNGSSSTVTLKSIAIAGTSTGSFVQVNGCGSTLSAGASCTVLVSFSPSTAAAKSALLSISSSATSSVQNVTLSGTGTAEPTVKLSTSSISFLTRAHGTTSGDQVITVTNSGSVTATIYQILLGGSNPSDFVELNNCGSTLSAGSSCSIYVSFKPAAAASYSASLLVYDNATGSPQTVALSGKGD